MKFPENLVYLASEEDRIKAQSREYVNGRDDLLMHMNGIEICMDTLRYFILERKEKDVDDLVIKLLATRIFNSSASVCKLYFSGYYQSCAMIMRDILETTFLLDYFNSDSSLIQQWRELPEKEREKLFRASRVRKALDKRDGFTSNKREEHYKLLCELGTHPTPTGFGMLKKKGGTDHYLGPFFDEASLRASIQEHIRLMLHATGHFSPRYKIETLNCLAVKVEHLEFSMVWFDRFYNSPPTQDQLDALAFWRGELDAATGGT